MTRLRVCGDEALLARVRPELERARASGESANRVFELDGTRFFAKWSSLRGKARARHAVRGLWGLPLPRLKEQANLTWLRERGFGAPRPALAGAAWRGLAPTFQFLLTEEVEDARTLRELFETGEPELRLPALEALGRDLGRMHAQGFVHRDLYPRNLLVTGTGNALRIHFLDAWRGGPGFGLRGPDYDLGCLMLSGATLFDANEQTALLAAYFAARERHGRPAGRAKLLAAAARERTQLLRRHAGRSGPAPPAGWNPPPP